MLLLKFKSFIHQVAFERGWAVSLLVFVLSLQRGAGLLTAKMKEFAQTDNRVSHKNFNQRKLEPAHVPLISNYI